MQDLTDDFSPNSVGLDDSTSQGSDDVSMISEGDAGTVHTHVHVHVDYRHL